MPGLILDSQYLPLTACPSLTFISLYDSAGSAGMEARGTGKKTKLCISRIAFLRWKPLQMNQVIDKAGAEIRYKGFRRFLGR